MTEPKFTHAPWITEKAKRNGFVIYELGVGKKTIARMPECSFSIYGNLIAAAPDLYNVLSDVVDRYTRYGYHVPIPMEMLDSARKALVKARGE